MKSPYVSGLVPNEVVTAYFLVLSKEVRQRKTGEPYLSLHLADRTGEIEAKMWDNVGEVMGVFDRDDFVKVKAVMQVYQNRPQLTLHRLRRLEDHEVDFDDFFPCSERDPGEMFAELQATIAGIGNEHLRALLQALFDEPRLAAAYKIAPAAKSIHHACRGGLIEHVLSLCKLCRFTASHYRNIDLDLLFTGAILHDIGKVEELSYARSFGYSADGQLLGHIVIGLRLVGAEIDRIPSFPPKLRTLVEHMIVSHHGELEFGSPKVPAFPEALLLHHLDNLDSKMEAMRAALSREDHSGSEFTPWIAPLDRALLRRERYLAEAAPPAPPPASETSTPAPDPGSTATPAPKSEPPEPEKADDRSAPMTSFGEKLHAVLAESEPGA
ncbi:MAG: 3'-5' exoribonuclease YhaM family protein [Bryobacteraceae bacterium]